MESIEWNTKKEHNRKAKTPKHRKPQTLDINKVEDK